MMYDLISRPFAPEPKFQYKTFHCIIRVHLRERVRTYAFCFSTFCKHRESFGRTRLKVVFPNMSLTASKVSVLYCANLYIIDSRLHVFLRTKRTDEKRILFYKINHTECTRQTYFVNISQAPVLLFFCLKQKSYSW